MAQTATASAKPAAAHNLQAPAKKPAPLNYSRLTTDLPKLGKEIDNARVKAAKLLDIEFQRLALSAIYAVQQHGNVHYVNALWLALPLHAAPAPWYYWRSKVDGARVCAQTSPGPGWERDSPPYEGPGCQPRTKVIVVPMR